METDAGIHEAWAPARVALAGSPSDGYGGAVLGLTVDALQARARVGGGADCCAPDLVEAAVARFARTLARAAAGTAIGCETTIPRSVGLGGSSAIVIATLRALSLAFEVTLTPLELAAFALAVEVESLGIAAAPQDPIAQAFGGLTFMDFASGSYESLDPAHLPPLLVAWRAPAAGAPAAGAHAAGAPAPAPAPAAAAPALVHDDLRGRFERRDPIVLRSLEVLADAAHEARAAVVAGDHESLARAVDASFQARAAMLELDPRHVELVELARDAGASANYAGSGGAIVCVCRDADVQADARTALVAAGCEVLPA